MKIAYVNKTRWLSNMPSTVFSFMNAYSFAQNGCETTAVFKEKNVDIEKNYTEYFDVPAISIFDVITFPDKYLLIKSNESFYTHVNKYLSAEENRPDLIITRDPGYLPFLVKLKKKYGIKSFYQTHNFYLAPEIRNDYEVLNRKKYTKYENKYIPRLDGVLALNGPHKELYEKYTNIPVYAGKPGLKKVHEPQDNFDKKIILYSGSFQLKKGLDILLEALQKLREIDFRLVLAGGRNDNEINLMKGLLREYGLEEKSEITGWLSYSQLEKRIRDATAGIIPLKETFYNRYLTAPSKLFDYLSFGVPVVASLLPSIDDLIGNYECGELFYPVSANNLRNSILKILENRDLYLKYSRNSNVAAEDYLWQKRAADMIEFMERC